MISKGCEQCAKGGKMVLFVYGYCDQRDCFYCPLGENRKNVTDVYANERRVDEDSDVVYGKIWEPAARLAELGVPEEFYTEKTDHVELAWWLAEASLDEIRFHPPYELWGDMHGTEWEEILYVAREAGLTPAFEIPGIRAETEFLDFLDEGAADFCNINEFEMSDGNAKRMQEAGFELREGHMSAVEGSHDVLDAMGDHEQVYYCTSVFKDAAQHRNRLKRMARVVRRGEFDDVTDDGTLVYGKIWEPAARLAELGVPEEFYTEKTDHVELAWWLAEEMIEEGDIGEGEIVEQYPTADGTVVERTPLA
ncbi:MAG: radical SAM protein [Halobacteriales archaeon SW_9_67_24]|nr:MAG: radical SAM protein [Halobacteriales archaeon SW_9_67_24]